MPHNLARFHWPLLCMSSFARYCDCLEQSCGEVRHIFRHSSAFATASSDNPAPHRRHKPSLPPLNRLVSGDIMTVSLAFRSLPDILACTKCIQVYKTSPERASPSSSHHAAHSAENHSRVGTRQNFENVALRHGMFIGFRPDDKLLQLKLKWHKFLSSCKDEL